MASSQIAARPSSGHRTLGETLVVVVAYFGLTVYFTWPLFPNMASHAIDGGDYLITTYIQTWVAHSLMTHPAHILNMKYALPGKTCLSWFGQSHWKSVVVRCPYDKCEVFAPCKDKSVFTLFCEQNSASGRLSVPPVFLRSTIPCKVI